MINKSTEWSTVPVCHSVMSFSSRGSAEETNSSKIWCLTFVYVLFYVNLCQDRFRGFSGICDLMICVQSKQEAD